MTTTDAILAELTGPGGPFEIVTETVRGVPVQVYRQRMTSMRDLVAQAALRSEDDFLVQGERRLTFGEHDTAVRQVAASLGRFGVRPGDRVAILSANNPEWVITFWATAVLGAVAVPLNAWWKAEELAFGLEDSGARVLVTDARRAAAAAELLPALRDLDHVFVAGESAPPAPLRPYEELLAAGDPGELPSAPVGEDDLLAIMYTSGTTGQPKGATVTHRQVLANLANIFCAGLAAAAREPSAPEPAGGGKQASLLVVPLFHVTGCFATMVTAYATGAKLVLMPPGRFDPDVAMATIERERVTTVGGVPTVMWRIVEAPDFDRYDLSSVTRVSYGGAPAAPELVARIAERFPNVRGGLATAYGLTETASVATLNAGADYLAHPDSVGRAVPTVELRVVGPSGEDLPVGEAGEIWIKGPTVMSHGYWRRPDANAESFTDGWFHTGDIGRLDEDGFLYLVDRAKDVVIRGGENISSVEVEHVLFSHPDVLDAAVVGVPHRELGEQVKAVVQLRPGSATGVEDLRAFCAEHLADFKVPELVELRDEPLPRNPAGKVLKRQLRGGETSFAAADDSAL